VIGMTGSAEVAATIIPRINSAVPKINLVMRTATGTAIGDRTETVISRTPTAVEINTRKIIPVIDATRIPTTGTTNKITIVEAGMAMLKRISVVTVHAIVTRMIKIILVGRRIIIHAATREMKMIGDLMRIEVVTVATAETINQTISRVKIK
jgi:hypothetical protein